MGASENPDGSSDIRGMIEYQQEVKRLSWNNVRNSPRERQKQSGRYRNRLMN
jgi:hypothetical protein